MGAVEILQSGKRYGWGRVSDISLGGCFIETDRPLPSSTEAQLRLTIANVLLEICAKAVFATPLVGMGMEFKAVPQEQENKLSQIIEKVTATEPSPALPLQQAERPQPNSATVRITREAAPDILAKIINRVSEKGVVTKQEILDIVKTRE
jgi:hypothetical protein